MAPTTPMDLRFTPEQERFRAEARAWLEANAPGPGPGRPAPALPSLDTRDGFEAHRAWERTMSEARWSVVSWPEEYGGRGAGLLEWLIFEEEYYRLQAPTRVGQNGIFLLAPTLFEFGTPEQKARYLPPMASGREIWCQGWSEPDAGSDLAAIRSRATRRGRGWVLEGQKTWCSRGAFADWIFGLFRSDPEAERHRGLTYFLVPMDAPGVTVRPIAQLDGETGFAEVFFDGVEVPDEQVLGTVGQGWSVAMATAGSERGLSLRSPARYTEAAARLVELYRRCAAEDPVAAARCADAVARAVIDAEAYRLHTYWTATRVLDGHGVGPEASMNKLFWSETDLLVHETALTLLGPRAELLDEDGRPPPWLDGFLFALAGPIYAGTNEIQRNVVAERVLGLPRA
ncbi:MAG TPA: acyl-CoA dehydrogenase family protein [Acidimicrobiales bacterium]|nr:acyl-CoA dehydrogenase family protein [Acidimicrobiales bacterium]